MLPPWQPNELRVLAERRRLLVATASLQRVPYHEYQHSIFDKNLIYTTGDMACADGFYTVPTGAGHGVEPAAAVFDHVIG